MGVSRGGRARRVKDFESRKAVPEESVFSVEGVEWEYIPVHPLADEVDLLCRLGVSPEQCVSVDCYWRFGDDVALLQVVCQKAAQGRAVGYYARLSEGAGYLLNLVAVVDADSVRHCDLQRVMRAFFARGLTIDGSADWSITNRLSPVQSAP